MIGSNKTQSYWFVTTELEASKPLDHLCLSEDDNIFKKQKQNKNPNLLPLWENIWYALWHDWNNVA